MSNKPGRKNFQECSTRRAKRPIPVQIRWRIRHRSIPDRIGTAPVARFLPVGLPTALVAQFCLRRPRLVPAMAEVAAVSGAGGGGGGGGGRVERVCFPPRGGFGKQSPI